MTREERADRANRAREQAKLYSGPASDLAPRAEVLTIGEAVSFAIAFADAEAAAMRERAAGVCAIYPASRIAADLATAIRALPATGEVGRG